MRNADADAARATREIPRRDTQRVERVASSDSPSLCRVSAVTQAHRRRCPFFGSSRFRLKLYAGLFTSASASALYALCVGTSGLACIASHAAMLRLTLSLLVPILQFGSGQHAQAAQTKVTARIAEQE
jgi:hypothetical protein